MKEPFWIVWCDNGGVPTVKHPTVQSARAEAERLARTNAGRHFHVLQVIGSAVYAQVNWEDYDPIPF